MCFTLSTTAPDGFIVHSHSGDDWRICRDYVVTRMAYVGREQRGVASADRSRAALMLWSKAQDPVL